MIIREHCQPGGWRNKNNWLPLCAWSENTTVQWGNPNPKEGQKTFFEVFVDVPSTIIHCEGDSLEEAEAKCWKWLQKYINCPQHEFERQGYTNGYGTCKHCGLRTSGAFEPIEYCCQCNNPKGYGHDNQGRWWCRECYQNMPVELWSETKIMTEKMKKEMDENPITDEQFNEELTKVITHMAEISKEVEL